MRPRFLTLLLVAIMLPVTGDVLARGHDQSSEGTGKVQVIEVTAKKYDFTPSSIRVKQGTKVELKITATDRSHGFKIQEFPEGENKLTSPGLVFSSPQDCLKIEGNQTQTIDFVAQTPGTYAFRCCVHCGWRHGSMKGELIVEP
jgi:cytochrome c oxidase subunit II